MMNTRHVFRQRAARLGATTALLAVFAALPAAAAEQPAADPIRGKAVFSKCSACHSVDTDANRLGPSLRTVADREAGTVAGYSYSPAMKNSEIVWTKQALDAFLTNPHVKVPGTKMVYAGIADAADRANIIAYLGANSPGKQ